MTELRQAVALLAEADFREAYELRRDCHDLDDDHWERLADRILAIPEIEEALKLTVVKPLGPNEVLAGPTLIGIRCSNKRVWSRP